MRLALLPMLALPVLVWASPGSANEQRCAELGSDCKCSEPLQFTGTVPGNQSFNPPDSTTAQCNGGGAIYSSLPLPMISPGSALGDTLPGVQRVMQVSTGNGGNMYDLNRDFTNGSYCLRNYMMFSTNYRVPRTTDRVKGPRNIKGTYAPGFETSSSNFGGSDPEMHFQPQGNHGTVFGGIASNGVLPPNGRALRFSDCKGHWCRWEICYDHNAQGQNRLRFRARVTRLSDGQVFSYGPEPSVGSGGQAQSGENSFPVMFFTQGYGTTEGYAYYSHVMTAVRRPANGNFWIGPAREIEGGGGGGGGDPVPPPPDPEPEPEPDPEPPAAPVLIEVN